MVGFKITYKDLINSYKKRITELGITQKEFARVIKVHHITLNRWLNKKSSMAMKYVNLIENALKNLEKKDFLK